ncbi:hypothetical protein BESB_069620 [Besnoitia besnoiti]|uniref:Bacterial alpha-2-macroglobulin MG10 domain-containing protein n=1 Tax=Besnoitia besnoiti TaxID=94643 RepID=A0A2A9MAK2_BESBE|nr:hypothetical protein BESB_069620 [Besnoitia besnoiti]PFH34929.1 hypothetical protein BESB_069620 [Besnoitia besnoiti]
MASLRRVAPLACGAVVAVAFVSAGFFACATGSSSASSPPTPPGSPTLSESPTPDFPSGGAASSAASFEPLFRLVALTPFSSVAFPQEGPLPVLRGRQPIVAVFSVPVVPLGGALFQEEPSSPSPSSHSSRKPPEGFVVSTNSHTETVRGRGYWVTPSAFRFDPDETWPADLAVSVRLNALLRSASGQPLAPLRVAENDAEGETGRGAERASAGAVGSSESLGHEGLAAAAHESWVFRMRTESLSIRLTAVSSALAARITGGQWQPLLSNSQDPTASLFEVPEDGKVKIQTSSPISVSKLRDSPLVERFLAVGKEQRGTFAFVPFHVHTCADDAADDADDAADDADDREAEEKERSWRAAHNEVTCLELTFPEQPLRTRNVYEVFAKKGAIYSPHSGPLGYLEDSSSSAPSAHSLAVLASAALAQSPAFISEVEYVPVSSPSRVRKGRGLLTGPRPFHLYPLSRRSEKTSFRRLEVFLPHSLGFSGEQGRTDAQAQKQARASAAEPEAAAAERPDLDVLAAQLARRMTLIHVKSGKALSVAHTLKNRVHLVLTCGELEPEQQYKLVIVGNEVPGSEAWGPLFDGFGLPLESSEIEFSMSRLRHNFELIWSQSTVWILNDRDLADSEARAAEAGPARAPGQEDSEAECNRGVPLAVVTAMREPRNTSWGDAEAANLEVHPLGDCIRRVDASCMGRIRPQFAHVGGTLRRTLNHEAFHFSSEEGLTFPGAAPWAGACVASSSSASSLIVPFLSRLSTNSPYLLTVQRKHHRSTGTAKEKELVGALSLSVFHSVHIQRETNHLVVNFQVLSLKTARPVAGATIQVYASPQDANRAPALLPCVEGDKLDGADEKRLLWMATAEAHEGAKRDGVCQGVKTDASGFATWTATAGTIGDDVGDLFATVLAPVDKGPAGPGQAPGEAKEPLTYITERLTVPWDLSRQARRRYGSQHGISDDSVIAGHDHRYTVALSDIHFFVLADRSSFRPGDTVSVQGLLSVVDRSVCGFEGSCLLHQALRVRPERLKLLLGAQWMTQAYATGEHGGGRFLPSPRGIHEGGYDGNQQRRCSVRIVSLNHFGAFETSLEVPLDAELGSTSFFEYRLFKGGDVDEKAILEANLCPEAWYRIEGGRKLRSVYPAGAIHLQVENPRPPSVIVAPLQLPPVAAPAESFAVSGSLTTYGGLPVQDHRVEIRLRFSLSLGQLSLQSGRATEPWAPAGACKFVIRTEQRDLKVVTKGALADGDDVELQAYIRTDETGHFSLRVDLGQLTVSPPASRLEPSSAHPASPLLWEEGTEISVTVRVTGLTGEVLPPQTATLVVASSELALERKLALSVTPVLPGVPFSVTADTKPYPRVDKDASLPVGSTIAVTVLRVDPSRPVGYSWEAQASHWESWNPDAGLAPCRPSLFSTASAGRDEGDSVDAPRLFEGSAGERMQAEDKEVAKAFLDGSVDLKAFVKERGGRFSFLKTCRGVGGQLQCPVTIPLDAAQYIFVTTLQLPSGKSVRNCEYFLPTAGNLLARALEPKLRLDKPEVAHGEVAHLVLPAVFREGSAIRPTVAGDAAAATAGREEGSSSATAALHGSLSIWWQTASNERSFFSVPLDAATDEIVVPIGRVPNDCPPSCSMRVIFVPPLSQTALPVTQVDTSTNLLFPAETRYPIERQAAAKYGPFFVDETLTVAVRHAASAFSIPEDAFCVDVAPKKEKAAKKPKRGSPAAGLGGGDPKLLPGEEALVTVTLSKEVLEETVAKSPLFSSDSGRGKMHKHFRAFALVAVIDKRYFDLGPVSFPEVEAELQRAVESQSDRHGVASSLSAATSLSTYLYLFRFIHAAKLNDPWITDFHWPSAGIVRGVRELTAPWAAWTKTVERFLLGRRSAITGTFSRLAGGGSVTDGVFLAMESAASAQPVAMALTAAPRMAKHVAGTRQEIAADSGAVGMAAESSSAVTSAKLLSSDTPVLLWQGVELHEGGAGEAALTGSFSFSVPNDSNQYLVRSQLVVTMAEREPFSIPAFFGRLWRRSPESKPSRVLYAKFEKEVVAKKLLKLAPFRPSLLRKGDIAQVGAILHVDESLVQEGSEVVVYLWLPHRGETAETGHKRRVKLDKTAVPVTRAIHADDSSLVSGSRALEVKCFAHLAANASVAHGVAFSIPVTPIAPRLSLSSIWPILASHAPRDAAEKRLSLAAADDAEAWASVVEGVELPLPVIAGVGGLSASVGLGYGPVLLAKIQRFLYAEVCRFVPAEEAYQDLLKSHGETVAAGRRGARDTVFCTCCREALPSAAFSPFVERGGPSLSSLVLAVLARQTVAVLGLQVPGELAACAAFAEKRVEDYVPQDAELFKRLGFLPWPAKEYRGTLTHQLDPDVDLNLLVLLAGLRRASHAFNPYLASVKNTILSFLQDMESRFIASASRDLPPFNEGHEPRPTSYAAASSIAVAPMPALPLSLPPAAAETHPTQADVSSEVDFSSFLSFVGPDLVARIRLVFGCETPLKLANAKAEEALSFPSLLRWASADEAMPRSGDREGKLLTHEEGLYSPHMLWAFVAGLAHPEEKAAAELLSRARTLLEQSLNFFRILPESSAYLTELPGSSVAASDAHHALLIIVASVVLAASSGTSPRSAQSTLRGRSSPPLRTQRVDQLTDADIAQMFSKLLLYLARGGKRGRMGLRSGVTPWNFIPFRDAWSDFLVMDAFASWDKATKNDRADMAVSVQLATAGTRDELTNEGVRKPFSPTLPLLQGRLSTREGETLLETKLGWTELEESHLLTGESVSFVSSGARPGSEKSDHDQGACCSSWEGKVRVNVKGEGMALVAIGMDFISDRDRVLPTFTGALVQKEFFAFDSASQKCGTTPVVSAVRGQRICVSIRVTLKDELRDVIVRDLLPAGLELSSRDPSMLPNALVENAPLPLLHAKRLHAADRSTIAAQAVPSWSYFPSCTTRLLGNAVEWKCPFMRPGTHAMRVIGIATTSGFFAVPMATVEIATTGKGVQTGTEALSWRRQEGNEFTLLGASGAAKTAFAIVDGDSGSAVTGKDAFREAGLLPPPAWLMGSAPKGCGVCPPETVCSPALGRCIS